MGILAKVFGSDKERETIVTGAVSGLDKLFFTDEEKSEVNMQAAGVILKYMEATQPQNVARRLLAFIVAGLWAFLVMFAVLVWKLDADYSVFIFETLAELVATPFSIIIGFYFLTHTVRAYVNGSTPKGHKHD